MLNDLSLDWQKNIYKDSKKSTYTNSAAKR